jgi:uncharacterized protein YbjT (DUF2867 family)
MEPKMSGKLRILVMGATGQQGGSVTRALIEKGHTVYGMTRRVDSPAARELTKLGVKLVTGDLNDVDALTEVFKGYDGVFGLTTPYEAGVEIETQHGLNLIEAAEKAGVTHLVFSSVGKADTGTGIPHFDSKYEAEKNLRTSNVPYTIIGPVFFMENWLSPWFLPGLQDGNAALAMPADRKLAHISVQDIGNFVALVFERKGEFIGKRYDLAGDDLTGNEIAVKLGAQTNRVFGFYEIPIEGMRAQNEDFALMFEWFDKIGYNVDVQALKRDYPEVGWTSFDTWIKQQDWSVLDKDESVAADSAIDTDQANA